MDVRKNLIRIVEDFTEGLRQGFSGKPKPKRPVRVKRPRYVKKLGGSSNA